MAFFAPWGNQQFVTDDGSPASGWKLYSYLAGSSTPATTYCDEAGTIAQTNPIVLDTLGFVQSGQLWFAGGQAIKLVLTDENDVAQKTEDNLVGINDNSVSATEWVVGPTPTYISGTSFSVAGDQTTVLNVGRRIKTGNSGGSVYSTIAASVFASVTTVTVENDSGSLDAGLATVEYGIISAANGSIPVRRDQIPAIGGFTDPSKRLRFEVDGFTASATRVATPPDYDHRIMSQTHGADIASPAGGTLNLDTATGDLVDVTGTNAITAITLSEGRWAMVRFTGALVLTNGASLVLPTSANITTAAGDYAVFRGYAAGVVRCVSYDRGTGSPLILPAAIGGSLVLLSTQIAVGSAQLDFTSVVTATYSAYLLDLENLAPSSDGATLQIRVSTNNGSSYLAGTEYNFINNGSGTSGAGAFNIALTVGSAANRNACGAVRFRGLSTGVIRFNWETESTDNAGADGVVFGGGSAGTGINAIRVRYSAGNIQTGTARLYGLKPSG